MTTMGFLQNNTVSVSQKMNTSFLVPETFTHAIAFGQTGAGKTSGFIYPNLLKRLENGHGVLLYDYKGKEHMSVKHLAQQVGRLDDVLEVGKPWGVQINMVEKMDEEELDRFFDRVLRHSDDNKFWHNSAKSLGQSVFKVLKSIEHFVSLYNTIDASEQIGKTIKVQGVQYPTVRNFNALVKVCRTFETLSAFVKRLDDLHSWCRKEVRSVVLEYMEKHDGETSDIQEQISDVLMALKGLQKCIEETADSLDSVGQDSNENLTQNIIGSLVGPLLTLAQNRFFNTNDFDITQALNEGKIVVINTEALSDEMLESLNSIILYELSQRTRLNRLNPVTIFIDEAQRVLSEHTDLPIDVLREAKVDVILATQNRALLVNKLKQEYYDALMGNLTRQYFFQNREDEEVSSSEPLNTLDSFEYFSTQDSCENVHVSRPLFINQKEKLAIELLFQQRHSVVRDYAYSHWRKKVILEYVPRLYKKGKVLLVSLKTESHKEVQVESAGSRKEHSQEVKKFLKEVRRNHRDRYKYIDDDIFYIDDEIDIDVEELMAS